VDQLIDLDEHQDDDIDDRGPRTNRTGMPDSVTLARTRVPYTSDLRERHRDLGVS